MRAWFASTCSEAEKERRREVLSFDLLSMVTLWRLIMRRLLMVNNLHSVLQGRHNLPILQTKRSRLRESKVSWLVSCTSMSTGKVHAALPFHFLGNTT